jgi:hypothetical protein
MSKNCWYSGRTVTMAVRRGLSLMVVLVSIACCQPAKSPGSTEFWCYADPSLGAFSQCVHSEPYCERLRSGAATSSGRGLAGCGAQAEAYCTQDGMVTTCSATIEGCEQSRQTIGSRAGPCERQESSTGAVPPGSGWHCSTHEGYAKGCFRGESDCEASRLADQIPTPCSRKAVAYCTSFGLGAPVCTPSLEACEDIRAGLGQMSPTDCVAVD